jgi:hypothetical protein
MDPKLKTHFAILVMPFIFCVTSRAELYLREDYTDFARATYEETDRESLFETLLVYAGASDDELSTLTGVLVSCEEHADWAQAVLASPEASELSHLVALGVVAAIDPSISETFTLMREMGIDRPKDWDRSVFMGGFPWVLEAELPLRPIQGSALQPLLRGYTEELSEDEVRQLESLLENMIGDLSEGEENPLIYPLLEIHMNQTGEATFLIQLWDMDGSIRRPSLISRVINSKYTTNNYINFGIRAADLCAFGDDEELATSLDIMVVHFLRGQRLSPQVQDFVEELLMSNPGRLYRHLPDLISILACGSHGSSSVDVHRLSRLDWLMGHCEEMLQETRRAVELYPITE